MNTNYIPTVFLLLCVVFAATRAAEVQLRGDAQPRTILAAPLSRYSTSLSKDFQLSGILRTYLARNCNNSSDNIVLVAPQKGTSLHEQVHQALEGGAQAVLMFSSVPSFTPGALSRMSRTIAIRRQAPVFELRRDDALVLWNALRDLERSGNISTCELGRMNLTLSEENKWDTVFAHPATIAVFDVLLPLLSLVTIIFATYKLILTMKKQGIQVSVPVVFLTLECISGLFRLLFLAIDPFGKRGVWPYPAWTVLVSISWPITLINTLLIALFYKELDTGALRMGVFLDEMQIPYVIISVFLVVVEVLATSFQASYYNSESLKIVVRLTYSLLTMCVSAMLLHSGTAVLKRAAKNSMRTRGTKFMMAGSVFMILYSLVLLFVVYGESTDPIVYVVSYSLLFVFLFVISIVQVAAFDPNHKGSSSSAGSEFKSTSSGSNGFRRSESSGSLGSEIKSTSGISEL